MKKLLVIIISIFALSAMAFQGSKTPTYYQTTSLIDQSGHGKWYFWDGSKTVVITSENEMLSFAASLGWRLHSVTATHCFDGDFQTKYVFEK